MLERCGFVWLLIVLFGRWKCSSLPCDVAQSVREVSESEYMTFSVLNPDARPSQSSHEACSPQRAACSYLYVLSNTRLHVSQVVSMCKHLVNLRLQSESLDFICAQMLKTDPGSLDGG
jgi:hypothetical protein